MSDHADFIPCSLRQLQGDALIHAAERAVKINPVNRPVVLNRAEALGLDFSDRALTAVLTDRKWKTNGVHLTVSFLDSPSAELRARILLHLNAWSDNANVSFRETGDVGQVRIARAIDGHWSYLGTDILEIQDDEPTMNLQNFTMETSDAEFRRVVRHEAGHTLGFPHEHMRRRLVERLHEEKVINYFAAKYGWSAQQTRQQVLTPLSDAAIIGTPDADDDSIMCYELPGSLTRDGLPIRGGDDINQRDAEFAASCYPKVQAGAARPAEGEHQEAVVPPVRGRGWSFQPGGPFWKKVDRPKLGGSPYAQTCSIAARINGRVKSRGTGWLCQDGVIATAAHVVEDADECEVQWAGSSRTHRTRHFRTHESYRANKVGSEVDLARIEGVPSPASPLPVSTRSPSSVAVLGYHAGDLVEHQGAAVHVGSFIFHKADTEQGHSGGPILDGADVVGLHVANAPETLEHLPHHLRARARGMNNAGIALTAASSQFLFQ